jgi:site-specific DNA-methyltransferase (adenine-specific)
VTPYYDEAGITLYHGKAEDVVPALPAGSFDMVFTSPPYNLGNTTGGGSPNRYGHYDPESGMAKRGGQGKWASAALAFGYQGFDDNLPHEVYVAQQREMLTACWRLLSDRGAIYYNHKPRVLDGIVVTPLAYVPPELAVRQIIIWARAGGINFSPAFYVPTHEWIVVIAKPNFRLKSKGASGVGDVWYVPQEADPSHPAPFPITLPARAIETAAPATVLDPYAGRGTTLWAAKNAGIRAVGIEQNERYCEMAVSGLRQGVLFGIGGAA